MTADQRFTGSQLAASLSRQSTLSPNEAEAFVKSFFDVIRTSLVKDKIVKVRGLGIFKLVDVEARESIKVGSGERFTIEGHSKVTFTPDAVLRDAVNRPFADFETVVVNDGVDIAMLEAVEPIELSADDAAEPPADDAVGLSADDAADLTDDDSVEFPPEDDTESSAIVSTETSADDVASDADEVPVASVILQTTGQNVQEPAPVPLSAPIETDTPDSTPIPDTMQANEVSNPQQPATPVAESTEHLSDIQPEEAQPATEPEDAFAGTDDQSDSGEEEVRTDAPAEDLHRKTRGRGRSSQVKDATIVRHADVVEVADYVRHSDKTSHRRRRWPGCLFGLFCLVLGYVIGCYLPVKMPTLITRQQTVDFLQYVNRQLEAVTSSLEDKKDTATVPKPDTTSYGATVSKPSPKPAVPSRPVTPQRPPKTMPHAPAAAESSVSYPQLPGGDYEIVGVEATEVMSPGKTLLKLSNKYYGSKRFVDYICVMNGISNPDIVPQNKLLRIPKLRKK